MKAMYFIVGAGGFGREVLPLAREQLRERIASEDAIIAFAVEGAPSDALVNGTPVFPLDHCISYPGERYFTVAIGNSATRERVAEKCIHAGCQPFEVRASTAIVMDGCEIGPGAILCPNTIITSNVKIGSFFHANLYSYVAHDCIVGDFVTLAPKAACNGNVHLEDHCYVGTGAIVREGSTEAPMRIGRKAVVGMGSVVTRSVVQEVVVVGSPARILESRRP